MPNAAHCWFIAVSIAVFVAVVIAESFAVRDQSFLSSSE
jgi:dolichyl-phosphate-mannose--protein O-mannosyl transferase